MMRIDPDNLMVIIPADARKAAWVEHETKRRNPPATQEATMAAKKAATSRKTTEVTTRFKTTTPKPQTALKKPRPARAKRASSHTVSLTGKAAELKAFITGHGKTLAEIAAKFGWQAHSARAAISGLNKPDGTVKKEPNSKGDIVYSLPAPK